MRPKRLVLRPERPDLRPERPDLRPERLDLGINQDIYESQPFHEGVK